MSVSDGRFFDHDPLTGVTEYFYFNPDDDSFTIESRQDVAPLLEFNKYLFNNAPLRFGEFNHVASIPEPVLMQLAKDGIVSAGGAQILDEDRFRRWLNERDNRLFRTWPGKV